MSEGPAADEGPLEYVCRLCGWEFRTLDGLWGHIPFHLIHHAVYGTLVAAEKECDALRAERDKAEKALAYRYRQSEGRHQLINELADTKKFLESEWAQTRATLAEVTAERDKAVRFAIGLEHDYAAANAEREEMRERGERECREHLAVGCDWCLNPGQRAEGVRGMRW